MSQMPTVDLSSDSLSMAVRMSVASDVTSAPSGRSHASDLIPSSYRPWRMSHLLKASISTLYGTALRGEDVCALGWPSDPSLVRLGWIHTLVIQE